MIYSRSFWEEYIHKILQWMSHRFMNGYVNERQTQQLFSFSERIKYITTPRNSLNTCKRKIVSLDSEHNHFYSCSGFKYVY